jgi:hypothetical protein
VPGVFAAFSGREYTNSSNPHTLVIPPGDTDTVCGLYDNRTDQTAPVPASDQCASEDELYRWIHRSSVEHGGGDGILIRAHPQDPAYPEGRNWHPLYRRTILDRSIQGIEVGGLRHRRSGRRSTRVLARGTVCSAVRSDAPRCTTDTELLRNSRRLRSGATICWVALSRAPDSPDLIRAMRERRCHY